MIFKIKVDDFWLDEEELSVALKDHIISCCVLQITKSIEEKVNTQIKEAIQTTMNEKLEKLIDTTIAELMETQTILVNKQPVTIKDNLKTIFQNSNGWRNPGEQIKSFAKKFGEDMRLQYNAAFANQIVANMKEQGFLKDEVTQILLSERK